jgi:hypothetical protein
MFYHNLAPSEARELNVMLKPGRYTVSCTRARHAEHGMMKQITAVSVTADEDVQEGSRLFGHLRPMLAQILWPSGGIEFSQQR